MRLSAQHHQSLIEACITRVANRNVQYARRHRAPLEADRATKEFFFPFKPEKGNSQTGTTAKKEFPTTFFHRLLFGP